MILLGTRLEAPEDDHHDDSDEDDDDDLPPSLSPDIGPRPQPSLPTSGAGRTSPQHRSVLLPEASTKAQCLQFSLCLSQTVLPLMRFIYTFFSQDGMEGEKDVFAGTI